MLRLLTDAEQADAATNAGGRKNDYALARGQALARAGDIAAAYAVFKEILGRSPKELRFYGSATEAMLGKKEGGRALEFAEQGLKEALGKIPQIREEFWKNVNVLGSGMELNPSLEYSGRVADYLEFAELLAYDALMREESCGGHFREEYQTEDGEALRNDEKFSFVAAWEFKGIDQYPVLHREPLIYEEVRMTQRSYK